MKTKIGRVAMIVDTSDIGPLAMAQNWSSKPMGTTVSLNVSKPIAESRRRILYSSLKTLFLIDINKKKKDIQNALIQYIFQKEIWPKAYLLAMLAAAISKLELIRRKNDFPNQVFLPIASLLIEATTAPATTIIIASHCKQTKLSPNIGIAIMATKTG